MPYKDINKYRECGKIAQRKYRAANPEKSRAASKKWKLANREKVRAKERAWHEKNPNYSKNKHLMASYGITLAQRDGLWNQQGNVCVICKRVPRRLNVDHGDGFIRGILCTSCNTSLGKLQHNPGLLRLAADYLEGKLTTFIKIERNKNIELAADKPS